MTKWEGLYRKIPKQESMPYTTPKPYIGVYVHDFEDEMLKSIAKENKITRAQIARGCMRAGLQLFEKDPEKVLALAKVGEC